MPRRSRLAFAAILALTFLITPALHAGDTSNLPAWSPDPALVKSLGPAVTMLGYQVRPPKGYEMNEQGEAPNLLWIWSGPAQANGTHSVFLVGFNGLPADRKSPKADDRTQLATFLAGILKHELPQAQNWSQTKEEFGAIDGRLFARSYWTCIVTRPADGQKLSMHGVDYATIDGNNGIILSVMSMDPIAKVDLPIGEAAAQTFRSTGATNP